MNIDKNFDLNLLRVFSYIYTYRNLTKAAVALGVTQPAVSRSLGKLNKLYGQNLFLRKHNEMIPSRLAEHMADNVFNMLREVDYATQFIQESDSALKSIDLKIGMNDYCINLLFNKLYNSFSNDNSSVSLHTMHCTYTDVISHFETLQIDGAIVSQAVLSNRYESTPLFTDDYVVICKSDHPVASIEYPLARYIEMKHILVSYTGSKDGWVDSTLSEIGCRREIACTVHLFSLLPTIITELGLLATIPRKMALSLQKNHPISIYELPFESKVHHFNYVQPRCSATNHYKSYILRHIMKVSAEV